MKCNCKKEHPRAISIRKWLDEQRKKGVITGWSKISDIEYNITFKISVSK